jgi:hypothetical protein
MITNYSKFNEGIDWHKSLANTSKEILNSIATKDEIEDFFLELLDAGSVLNITNKHGYFTTHFTGISKLSDLHDHECYPFYDISVNNTIDIGSSIEESIKKLNQYKIFINKIDSIQKRILHKSEFEIVDSYILMETNSIRSRILVKAKIRLDAIDDTHKSRSTQDKIVHILSTNKIFRDVRIVSNSIYFTVNSNMTSQDPDRIVNSIFKKFDTKVTIRKINTEVGQKNLSRYKIEI